MIYNCCEGIRPAKFSRRFFLKQGGIALAGLSTMPAFLQRAIASTPSAGKKQFVVLFQRGAADGLNIVVPFGEPNYYRLRPSSAIPIPDLRQFKVQPQSAAMANVAEGGFEAMYAQTVDHALHGTGTETFEAIDMLRKIDTSKYPPENGADYPKSPLGQRLQQIALMIKANIGLEVMFLDCGGWDNHVNEGSTQGQLANLLRDLSQSLAAFYHDMGDRMGDVVVVTMREIGRTSRENGNRGTDHRHANCMFVMGGDVKGGQVYGKWPGLNDHQLNEGRDLALTTDFRSVVGEN